jgi:hypothetical protein
MDVNNIIKLQTIKGNDFYIEGLTGDDPDEIAVTRPGYIITRDGQLVIVKSECHDEAFCEYLRHYLEEPCISIMPNDGVKKLNKLGHVVYMGIRQIDVCGCQANFIGYVFHPGFEKISREQHSTIRKLLDNNVSSISKRQMFEITFGNFDGENERMISQDEAVYLMDRSFGSVR